jgi:hypothetical protein
MKQPTPEPAIGGGDGKREASLVPDAMKRRALDDSANQLEKLAGGDAGAGDEVAPQNGESATASRTTMAIGAKKRNLRTSR